MMKELYLFSYENQNVSVHLTMLFVVLQLIVCDSSQKINEIIMMISCFDFFFFNLGIGM